MATQPLNQEIVHHIPLRLPTEAGELRTADLLTLALQNNAAIDVIERLVNLQRDEREYQARVAFDDALNRCQEKLEPVSADASNPQTKSKYASYKKLDKVVRPIYTAEGFSVSYTERDCPTPGKTRFVGLLSRGGITREYTKDLSPSTQGPKGNDVMTPIHADASADSYAKRYLLKDIFNIAIGEGDNDGNGNGGKMPPDRVRKLCFELDNAPNRAALLKVWLVAAREAKDADDREALDAFKKAKDGRKAKLQ